MDNVVKKYIVEFVEYAAIGPIIKPLAKKLTGHVFTKLPTASSLALVAAIGLLIFGIEYGLANTSLKDNKPFKELSSFVITQLICVGGMAAVSVSSTGGLMSVAITVAAVWLTIKCIKYVINKGFLVSSKNEITDKELESIKNSIVKCDIDGAELMFQKLGISKVLIDVNNDNYRLINAKNELLELKTIKFENLDLLKIKNNVEELKKVVNKKAFDNFESDGKYEKLKKLGVQFFYYQIILNLAAKDLMESSPITLIRFIQDDCGFGKLMEMIQNNALMINIL